MTISATLSLQSKSGNCAPGGEIATSRVVAPSFGLGHGRDIRWVDDPQGLAENQGKYGNLSGLAGRSEKTGETRH